VLREVLVEQFSQQVNFYRDEFKKKVIFLSSMQILLLSGAFILIFSILSVVQVTMLKTMEENAGIAIKQKERLNDQLVVLQEQFVEPKEDPELLKEISDHNDEITKKNTLVNFLGGESSKKIFSFSAVMESLSEQNVKGLWLTELGITTEGSRYRLVGNTKHPDLIPQYIDQLKKSKVLAGTSFNLFDLERSGEEGDYLKFILSSEEVINESEISSR